MTGFGLMNRAMGAGFGLMNMAMGTGFGLVIIRQKRAKRHPNSTS